MRIYLDMCCLKRPFDDQSQPRIHLESEAVLTLLGASSDRAEFVHGAALDLENDQNPLPDRAAKVRLWLQSFAAQDMSDADLQARTAELISLGFKSFDAFHLATAELAHADVLCTCDDRFLALAGRHAHLLQVRVANAIELAREIFP